jgi:hypothetical protein
MHLRPTLLNRIAHLLQHVGVLTRMNGRHDGSLDELEVFVGEGRVAVLLHHVLFDLLVGEVFAGLRGRRVPVFGGGCEVHPRGVVVLVVDDVHRVEPE